MGHGTRIPGQSDKVIMCSIKNMTNHAPRPSRWTAPPPLLFFILFLPWIPHVDQFSIEGTCQVQSPVNVQTCKLLCGPLDERWMDGI